MPAPKKYSKKPRHSFRNKVLSVVRRIPRGKTRTYGEVAAMAGNARAARAVGAIMAQNRDSHIPCHRVIGSGGKMVGYSGRGGIYAKRKRLQQEGAIE